MKQLTCEMCGSTDLIKDGGVFVCQSCGCKYSIEEAKRMMIEGTVDVQGTVSIDNSQKLAKLIQLAQRAKNGGNSRDAQKYYDMILLEDTENWEAIFYHTYFQSVECKIGEIATAAIEAGQAAKSALTILSKNEDTEHNDSAVEEIASALINLSVPLVNVSIKQYAKYRDLTNSYSEYSDRTTAAFIMLKSTADMIWETSAFNNAHAIKLYESAMKIAKNTAIGSSIISIREFKSMEPTIVERIREQKPDYETPIKENSEGCYVATAVYGSYDCPQVWTLRRFRDYTLAETWHGRVFIRIYYAISPTIVKWFGHTEWFKKMWKVKLDRMVASLKADGVEDTPYEDRKW